MWTERFYCAVFKDLKSERKGIHISHLIYDCLRRAYYDLTTDVPFDLDGGMRMWIGKQIHKLSISDNSELTLEWEGITGSVDEYQDGHFCDLKTTRNVPRSSRPHHVKQLEMYRVLLEKNGYEVKDASMVYINVDTTEVVEFPVKFKRNIETVEKEMLEKKSKLETALERGWLPERHLSWLCRYCNYSSRCFVEEKLQDPKKMEVE
ncbi:MAG: CRISPR-associated protein Cas4 [Candidatus Thorarchaeota archaeon]